MECTHNDISTQAREFNGRQYIMEHGITGDFSLIKAQTADTRGNLIFKSTARNFNPDCARAGKICIAEVEEIVEAGELPPDSIHLPGIYVHRVIKGKSFKKPIEKRTVSHGEQGTIKVSESVDCERISFLLLLLLLRVVGGVCPCLVHFYQYMWSGRNASLRGKPVA
jgi:acyl CoA:acetate/3-ketoacid CoA transferase